MIEDIEKVYASMATRKRVLDGILAFLATPQSAAALEKEVERLQEHSKSVYTSVNYSDILERAGAISKCTRDGDALDGSLAPQIVEVDGAAYYRPLGRHTVHWVVTDDGARHLASNDPLARLKDLFDKNERYLGVYKALLETCSVDGGKTTAEVGTLLDKHPLLQDPRHYTPYFIDQLDVAEAIAWDGAWKTTDAGIDGLAFLDTVESALNTLEA